MAILAQLQRFFMPRIGERPAQHLYIALVEQARNPYFFTALQVPDTIDGRFDMIVLHLHLVLDALKARFDSRPEWQETSRELIEYFIADMDRSLREMGASDTGIGRRIQKMTAAFYGRIDAYHAAGIDPATWQEALRRNVYGTVQDAPGASLKALADYVLASKVTLAQRELVTADGKIQLGFAEIR